MPNAFAYHSSLAVLTKRRGLLLRIAVAENCVHAPMSFFSSALFGGPSDATHDFEGVSWLVESVALLPLPMGVHSFVSDVWLPSPFQGSQAD